jgi:AcrR family transcriptional regulator
MRATEMDNKAINIRTKGMIIAALKKLMSVGALSSVSVNKIVNECGISRNTFYYHFNDIPAAIRWMLQTELPLLPSSDGEYDTHDYYYRKMYEILKYIENNRAIFFCIDNSASRQEFRKIYLEDMGKFFHSLVSNSDIASGYSRLFVNDLSHLLLISSLAIIESWAYGEIRKTPEELMDFIKTVFRNLLN